MLEVVLKYLPLHTWNEVLQLLDARLLVCELLVCRSRILLVFEYRLFQLSQHSCDVSLFGLCIFELCKAVCYLFQLGSAEHFLELFDQILGAFDPDIVRCAGDAKAGVRFLLGDFFHWRDLIVSPFRDIRRIRIDLHLDRGW